MPVILTIHERASESMSMTEQPASAGFCWLGLGFSLGASRHQHVIQPALAGLLRLA